MIIFSNKWGMLNFSLAFLYGKLRYFYYAKLKHRLKKFNGINNTGGVDYSMGSFNKYTPDTRIFWPIFLLSSIPDLKKDSLLILGPRFEVEILVARALGFEKSGIKALDMISYSPIIEIGDMHDLPYDEASFSGIICGWTISYSTNPSLAASEMSRVLARGGYIILAVQKVEREFVESIPGILPTKQRIQTLDQFDELFPDLIRVAGFETKKITNSTHTLVAYKKL